MKHKILNLLLIITSLLGYLEWSGDSRSFLYQAEGEILYKLFTDPASTIHPFILLPLLGQLLLLVTLFRKRPGKVLTYIGISGLGLLLGFMFVVGIISLNIRIIASTLPFLLVALYTIYCLRGTKSLANSMYL